MQRRLTQIDESIARYLAQLDSADRQGEAVPEAKVTRLNEKIATLRQEIRRLNALNKRTPNRSPPPPPGAPDGVRLQGRRKCCCRSAERISCRQFHPGSSGAFGLRLPHAIMEHPEGIGDAGDGTPPCQTSVQAAQGLISSGHGELDDETWFGNRLFGGTSRPAGRARAACGRAALRLDLVSRSVWFRCDHVARISRRQDPSHQARDRHHAAGRANTG